jgi:hypothetical protein
MMEDLEETELNHEPIPIALSSSDNKSDPTRTNVVWNWIILIAVMTIIYGTGYLLSH